MDITTVTPPPLPLALITGAAHRIGRAIALELSRQGFAIGLHYSQSAAAAEETAAEIAPHRPVYLLPADLTDPAQIEDLFARVAALPHALRVLVNSAAIMPRGGLDEMPVEAWDQALDLNLRAPWLCARAAAKLMTAATSDAAINDAAINGAVIVGASTGGSVINITESGAHKVWVNYPAYVISKAALETLTRLLARTLAPTVRVNAVAPGLILPSSELPPEQWQRLLDHLPLRTVGQPEDVARAVVFFIQNPYVTGQVLAVDGGYQLV